MARFWQHMASPVVSPIGVTSLPIVTSILPPNTVVKQNSDLKEASPTAQRDWHFLEVGPEGLEEGTKEVLDERRVHPGMGSSKPKNIKSSIPEWSMPDEVHGFQAQIIRPMLEAVKAALEPQGGGLVVVSHSAALGAKDGVNLVLALAARAAAESWKVAVVSANSAPGNYGLPNAPGWLDFLQGQCLFQDIVYKCKDSDLAWVPAGRELDARFPTFFKHSPTSWLREMKRRFSVVFLVCGLPDCESIPLGIARMGDGVLLLAKFNEANLLDRHQEDWSRKGLPILGQLVVP